MNINLQDPAIWAISAIWFSVPVLAWLWSFGSIWLYKKASALMKEILQTHEETKRILDEAKHLRSEAVMLQTRAENELKDACAYYEKIKDLLTKKESQ